MEGQEGNNNSRSPKETANNKELARIIRQCVREEIDMQRSGRNGNVGLLNRTRELIGNASRSASEDLAPLQIQEPGDQVHHRVRYQAARLHLACLLRVRQVLIRSSEETHHILGE